MTISLPQKMKNLTPSKNEKQKIVLILTIHHIGVYTNVVPRNKGRHSMEQKGERNGVKIILHPVSLVLSHKKREP